jgi:hypothetical protein
MSVVKLFKQFDRTITMERNSSNMAFQNYYRFFLNACYIFYFSIRSLGVLTEIIPES